MIFALFKKSKHFWFSWFSATKIEQHKTKKRKRAGNPFPTNFLFSSANFFFDLRVNNRVVVIINYPQKVKKQKKHSLINRNKQRKKQLFDLLALDLRGWEVRERVSHRQKQLHTHSQKYQRFIHQVWSCGAKIPHTQKISIIRNLLSYCKTFQTNQIHTHTQTQTDKKSNGFSITYTTSRSFIIITITLSLFVTVKCIGYIYINDMCL